MTRILPPGARATALAICCIVLQSIASEHREKAAVLLFQGLPGSAMVLIDGSEIPSEQLPRISVTAGAVAVRIDMDGSPVFKAVFDLRPGETSTLFLNSSDDRATLDVLTDPSGSRVYINGNYQGQTPFLTSFLVPGRHRVRTEKAGYLPCDTFVTMAGGGSGNLTLELRHSQAWIDSVAAVRKQLKRRRQLAQKIVFTALAVGLGGGGAYFDLSGRQSADRAEETGAGYDTAISGFSEYKDRYAVERRNAENALVRRDALYTASLGAVAGLVISFVF